MDLANLAAVRARVAALAPPTSASAEVVGHARAPATDMATSGAPDFSALLDTALSRSMAAAGTAGVATPSREAGITLAQMLAGAAPSVVGAASSAAAARAHAPAATAATGRAEDLGLHVTARPLDVEAGSGYGPRIHPIHGDVRTHHGVDMGAPEGTPIGAFAAGTVVEAGVRGGYGNLVILDHGNGITTRYAHQSSLDVAVGDVVTAGQVIGRVGSTGASTGPHLHFEIRRDGASIDPGPYLSSPAPVPGRS